MAAAAGFLAAAFLITTVGRAQGALAGLDVRLVAYLVPVQYPPSLLAGMRALVLIDNPLLNVSLPLAAMAILWLGGYRHTWGILLIWLSWPVEAGLQATLSQPRALDAGQTLAPMQIMLHGSGLSTTADWLHRAAPESAGSVLMLVGNVTVKLSSGYPSGAAARGAFLFGLFIWACLEMRTLILTKFIGPRGVGAPQAQRISLTKVLVVLALLALLYVFSVAVVLYSWHWPSEVLGGYLLGLALLGASLAVLRQPGAQRRRL